MPQLAARDGETVTDNKKLYLPTDGKVIKNLRAGTFVSVYGTLYTARDQAHKRIAAAIRAGEKLPRSEEHTSELQSQR